MGLKKSKDIAGLVGRDNSKNKIHKVQICKFIITSSNFGFCMVLFSLSFALYTRLTRLHKPCTGSFFAPRCVLYLLFCGITHHTSPKKFVNPLTIRPWHLRRATYYPCRYVVWPFNFPWSVHQCARPDPYMEPELLHNACVCVCVCVFVIFVTLPGHFVVET